MELGSLIASNALLVLVVIVLALAIPIMPEYQRLVVFHWARWQQKLNLPDRKHVKVQDRR